MAEQADKSKGSGSTSSGSTSKASEPSKASSSSGSSSGRSKKAGTDEHGADLGPTQPEIFRDRAEDVIPEHDDDNKAYKKQILADTPQAEAKAQAGRVKDQPASAATPSGHALVETAGIADDQERGAEYERIKRARRWG